MAVAEGFEPSAFPRSRRRNGADLRNDITSNSLALPRFVPKCAQNMPTARRADPQHAPILQTSKELTDEA